MNKNQKYVLIFSLLLVFVVIMTFTPYNHYRHNLIPTTDVVIKQLKGNSFGSVFVAPYYSEGRSFRKYVKKDTEGLVDLTPLNTREKKEYNTTHTINANVVTIDYPKLTVFFLLILFYMSVLIIILKK